MFAVLKCLRNARNWERVSKMSVIHGSRFVILANWEEVKIYSTTYLLLSAQPCCLSPRRVWLFGCPCHFRKKKTTKETACTSKTKSAALAVHTGSAGYPKKLGPLFWSSVIVNRFRGTGALLRSAQGPRTISWPIPLSHLHPCAIWKSCLLSCTIQG